MPRAIFLKARNGIEFNRLWVVFVGIALTCGLASACSEPVTITEQNKGYVIINAPANGVVRRVLVEQGASVEKDAALIEIGVPQASHASDTANSNAEREARAAET